jgi:hypothetical protein
MTRGARNPRGHGAVGSTHNINTQVGKLEGKGNPQGVSRPQIRIPIQKITYTIPDNPSRVESTSNTFIGSPTYESLKSKYQGLLNNPIEEPNHFVESNESLVF